jgi:pimeloyl-ACP methyl ester carboxylesterase
MALQRLKVSPLNVARVWDALRYQPSTTIQAMSRSIMAETSTPRYQQVVARVMASKPVHLVMGGRSQSISQVAPLFRNLAASVTAMPNASHMMTLEDPTGFQRVVLGILTASASHQSAGDAA